jgi:hypothetical protein
MIFRWLDQVNVLLSSIALLAGACIVFVGVCRVVARFRAGRKPKPSIWTNNLAAWGLAAVFVSSIALSFITSRVLVDHQRAGLADLVQGSFQIAEAPPCVSDRRALTIDLAHFSRGFPDHSSPTTGPRVVLRDADGSMMVRLLRDKADPRLYWLQGATYISAVELGTFRSLQLDGCA